MGTNAQGIPFRRLLTEMHPCSSRVGRVARRATTVGDAGSTATTAVSWSTPHADDSLVADVHTVFSEGEPEWSKVYAVERALTCRAERDHRMRLLQSL